MLQPGQSQLAKSQLGNVQPQRARAVAVPFVLSLALVLGVLAWQMYLGVNSDTTWLMLMAERWLDGERLYVDMHENNPPASIYLYVPAALIVKLTGAQSELVIQLFTLGLFAGAACAAYRMVVLAGFKTAYRFDWLAPLAIAIFLLMPASSFAQREHLAAILSLPVIGMGIVRCSGKSPRIWMILAAGISMGIIASIKPPMIMVAVLIAGMTAWHLKSWKVLFVPENWIGAGVFFAYLAIIIFLHPAFMRDVMPLLREVYLPNRYLLQVLSLPPVYGIFALVLLSLLIHRRDWYELPICMVYAAAAGFFFSYIVQMKFFDYHALPALIFLFLALGMSVLRLPSGNESGRSGFALPHLPRGVTIATLLVLGALNLWDFDFKPSNGNLTRLVQAIKPGAKVVGFGMVPGSELRAVRNASGRWVGSFGYTYVPVWAAYFRRNQKVGPDWEARLHHWEQWTADISARDIRQKRPDIILLREGEIITWRKWIKDYPGLETAMADYRFHDRVSLGKHIYSVQVYVRKTIAAEAVRHNKGKSNGS